VGVRELGAAVALAALSRLQLELTPSPGIPVAAPTRPTGAIKAEEALTPLTTVERPGGRAGDRNPEYRDADDPHSGGRNQQHSGLADDGGLKTRLL